MARLGIDAVPVDGGTTLRDLLASSKRRVRSAPVTPLRVVREPGERQSTVLVVGGAGYVGSILSAGLLDAGFNVIVLDPLLYGGESVAPLIGRPGFELYAADTRDEAIVRQLLGEAASVVHLGEIVGDPACDLDPTVTVSVNYTASVRLAALAAQSGVERFIYPSSCSVYGATDEIVDELGPLNPVSLYGRTKVSAEEDVLRLRSDSFHPTIFRLATVYGLSPRPRFDLVVNTLAGRAAAEGRIVVQGGGQWRPFIHVADVASLLAQTLTMPLDMISGEIFNLGANSQNHTIAGVAEIVRERLPEVAIDVTDGKDRRNYRVAFDKAADVLGFRPTRTVSDGVAEIVRAVENRHLVDVHDARHSNVRALVETDARVRLWRDDLVDGDPASAYRPRDIESPLRAALPVRQPVFEEAVS